MPQATSSITMDTDTEVPLAVDPPAVPDLPEDPAVDLPAPAVDTTVDQLAPTVTQVQAVIMEVRSTKFMELS